MELQQLDEIQEFLIIYLFIHPFKNMCFCYYDMSECQVQQWYKKLSYNSVIIRVADRLASYENFIIINTYPRSLFVWVLFLFFKNNTKNNKLIYYNPPPVRLHVKIAYWSVAVNHRLCCTRIKQGVNYLDIRLVCELLLEKRRESDAD